MDSHVTQRRRRQLATTIFLLGAVLSCRDCGKKDYTAPTLGEVRSRTPIPYLFIPRHFPNSLTDVSLRHDTDTFHAWMGFRFDDADLDAVIIPSMEQLRPEQIRDLQLGYAQRLPWWSDDLRTSDLRKADEVFPWAVYRWTREMTLRGGTRMINESFLALNPETNEGFHWQDTWYAPNGFPSVFPWEP